jgi:hypothetical protein
VTRQFVCSRFAPDVRIFLGIGVPSSFGGRGRSYSTSVRISGGSGFSRITGRRFAGASIVGRMRRLRAPGQLMVREVACRRRCDGPSDSSSNFRKARRCRTIWRPEIPAPSIGHAGRHGGVANHPFPLGKESWMPVEPCGGDRINPGRSSLRRAAAPAPKSQQQRAPTRQHRSRRFRGDGNRARIV